MNRRVTFLSVLLLCSTPFASSVASVRTVALTGRQAPGTPAGAEFSVLFTPVINAAGHTAFNGVLLPGPGGVSANNLEGIWSEGSGTLELIARSGSAATGTPAGTSFGGFTAPIINNHGSVVFSGSLQLGGAGVNSANNQGIWVGGIGGLALVARSGSQATGTPVGVNFAGLGPPQLNDLEQVAFTGRLQHGTAGVASDSDSGLWLGRAGNLNLIAREGSHAPGTPGGTIFANILPPLLNHSGDVMFEGELRRGFGDVPDILYAPNYRGVWASVDGQLNLVVRRGQLAIDAPSGAREPRYVGFRSLAMNTSGQLGFSATALGEAVLVDGIWTGLIDNLEFTIPVGSPAPGPPGDTVFYGGLHSLVLNGANEIAFIEWFGGGRIWSSGGGTLGLVTRSGFHAPGTSAGTVFEGFGFNISLNRQGQLAFMASLQDAAGVDSSNNVGIWAQAMDGTLQLICRTGELLEVAPGDFRTVESLNFNSGSGNEDGRPSSFSDRGHLAFWARFTDGSQGIFVSNLVAVPEPSALCLLCLGAAAVLLRRAG